MTSLAQIKQWSEEFPFDEGELEILLRCHASITSCSKDEGTFMNKLAHSFPYVFFFLPNDEMEKRTSLIEQHILPTGFGEKLKGAIFPCGHNDNDDGDEKEEDAVEKLINGVANCCRRGEKNALQVIFDCCKNEQGTAEPNTLVSLCYYISVASEILVSKRIDEKHITSLCEEPISLHGLTASLSEVADDGNSGNVGKAAFVDWAFSCAPHISLTLVSFTNNLIFHGKSTKSHHEAFVNPQLLDSSDIFTASDPSILFTIRCFSSSMGGKWRLLFSSKVEESATNCFQTAVKEHVGLSVFVIKTSSGAIIGGCTESLWKFGYFLFQVQPYACVYKCKGCTSKFFIDHNAMHETDCVQKKGYGFRDDSEFDTESQKARGKDDDHMFISDSFDVCSASCLGSGTLEIDTIEVWAVAEKR
jgi:hypothetical protein